MPLKITDHDIALAAGELGVGYAVMRALVEVEARSTGFIGDRLQILFEPHVAWRELKSTRADRKVRAALEAEGLAYEKAGARPYPGTLAARHAQLDRAVELAGARAFRWASYGLPQIMGFNAERAGYDDAEAMVNAFSALGEPEHLHAMVRWIAADRDLVEAMRARDWPAVARLYNGPAYAKHGYHMKLKRAFDRFSATAAPLDPLLDPWADGFLGLGDKGGVVRALQMALAARGFYRGAADGDFGPITDQAVAAWQRAGGRTVTGQIDRAAFALLDQPVGLPDGSRPGVAHSAPPAGPASGRGPAPAPKAPPTQSTGLGAWLRRMFHLS